MIGKGGGGKREEGTERSANAVIVVCITKVGEALYVCVCVCVDDEALSKNKGASE